MCEAPSGSSGKRLSAHSFSLFSALFSKASMRSLTRSGVRATIVVLALASTRASRVDAGNLHTLDLASLYRDAELIVLVENFRPGEKHKMGHGLVKKVFKGDYDLGDPIHVTPWGVDFGRVSGVPGGKLAPSFTAVFFLNRLSRRCWETVFSGVRIIIEDRIFSVRPAGSDTYRILPAKPELLEDSTP